MPIRMPHPPAPSSSSSENWQSISANGGFRRKLNGSLMAEIGLQPPNHYR